MSDGLVIVSLLTVIGVGKKWLKLFDLKSKYPIRSKYPIYSRSIAI